MESRARIWCDEDEHSSFECFADFNEWFDSEDAASERETYGISGIAVPSKGLFAGDKGAYEEAFNKYRDGRRSETLCQRFLYEQFSDNHWFDRNLNRFDQLVECLESSDVVPFVGAGMSVAGGFPTWKQHLLTQARTAGLDRAVAELLLASGEYERLISQIEIRRGRDVFVQEIRDAFSGIGKITGTTLLITELFPDTVITTNYDRLIEQAFDRGAKRPQVVNSFAALADPATDRVTIIKIHGDVKTPGSCILSKSQYDQAYGGKDLDLTRPIPKVLEYYYSNSSLLFLGCSLNNDRTVQVFRAVKQHLGDTVIPQHFTIEQAPETETELVERNAFLTSLGITGIWFEKNHFDCVELILRLAHNELRYRVSASRDGAVR